MLRRPSLCVRSQRCAPLCEMVAASLSNDVQCFACEMPGECRVDLLFVSMIVLNIGCLAAFQWGRRCYFRRPNEDRIRGGLGPLGTAFAIVQLPLVWLGGVYSNDLLVGVVVVLYLLSLLLFYWTTRSHNQRRPGIAFTHGAPEALVTSGAYQVARHPFYLSYLLFWAGVAVVAPFFLGLPILAVMGVLYFRTGRQEEMDIILSPLGSDYKKYRSRVGMFFRWPR